MKESEIESRGTKLLEQHGWWQFKIEAASKNGIPDRLYIREGRHVFIEWKADVGQPTRQQLRRHAEICLHGGEVRIARGLEDIRDLLI